MAEKHTTLEQMRLSALRSKTEILALLVSALEGVQVGMTITLSANNWTSGVQTVQNEGFVADDDYWYFVCPDASNYELGSGIVADNVTVNGRMTFHCELVPTSDVLINVIRVEI